MTCAMILSAMSSVSALLVISFLLYVLLSNYSLTMQLMNLDIFIQVIVVPSYFLIFPFPSQILPVRCLVSCLKHQYHLHSVLPCIKLFSVFHQHQSGGHIFFLSGVSDYARQNKQRECM